MVRLVILDYSIPTHAEKEKIEIFPGEEHHNLVPSVLPQIKFKKILAHNEKFYTHEEKSHHEGMPVLFL